MITIFIKQITSKERAPHTHVPRLTGNTAGPLAPPCLGHCLAAPAPASYLGKWVRQLYMSKGIHGSVMV